MKNTLIALMVVGFAALGTVTAVFSLQDVDSGALSQESAFAIGHVELTVLDEFGNVKQYVQSDNLVVTQGISSVSDLVLGTTHIANEAVFDTVIVGTNGFTEAIGDTLATFTQRSNRLQDDVVANSGSNGGIIQVIWDGANNVGTSDAAGNDLNNSTTPITINSVGLTTGGCSPAGQTQGCSNATTFPLFADKADTAGITVSIGEFDDLQVTWTVTFADSDAL